jgi:hypothetical protein
MPGLRSVQTLRDFLLNQSECMKAMSKGNRCEILGAGFGMLRNRARNSTASAEQCCGSIEYHAYVDGEWPELTQLAKYWIVGMTADKYSWTYCQDGKSGLPNGVELLWQVGNCTEDTPTRSTKQTP